MVITDLRMVAYCGSEMVLSYNDYWQCAKEVGKKLERSLGENFVSYFAIGSIGRDDLVLGWSDIDSVLVVRENNDYVKNVVLSLWKKTTERHQFLQTERGSKLCIFWMTLDDLLNCKVVPNDFPSALNFHDFRFNSKVITGKDISTKIKVPRISDEEIDIILLEHYEFLAKQKNSTPYWKGRNAIVFFPQCCTFATYKERYFRCEKEGSTSEISETISRGAGFGRKSCMV